MEDPDCYCRLLEPETTEEALEATREERRDAGRPAVEWRLRNRSKSPSSSLLLSLDWVVVADGAAEPAEEDEAREDVSGRVALSVWVSGCCCTAGVGWASGAGLGC